MFSYSARLFLLFSFRWQSSLYSYAYKFLFVAETIDAFDVAAVFSRMHKIEMQSCERARCNRCDRGRKRFESHCCTQYPTHTHTHRESLVCLHPSCTHSYADVSNASASVVAHPKPLALVILLLGKPKLGSSSFVLWLLFNILLPIAFQSRGCTGKTPLQWVALMCRSWELTNHVALWGILLLQILRSRGADSLGISGFVLFIIVHIFSSVLNLLNVYPFFLLNSLTVCSERVKWMVLLS